MNFYLKLFASFASVFVLFIIAYIFVFPRNKEIGCIIYINNKTKPEIGNPLPLILNPSLSTGNEFIYPNSNGILCFKNEDEILLACPGKNNKLNVPGWESTTEKNVICNNNQFSAAQNSKQYTFDKLVCNDYPEHSAKLTGKRCNNNNTEIVIGFKIKQTFLTQFTVCHDDQSMNTIWTHVKISSHIEGFQRSYKVKPYEFTEDIFYNSTEKKLDDLYRHINQEKLFQILFGAKARNYIKNTGKSYTVYGKESWIYVNHTGQYYLDRGHLVAKADFVYGIQQRSTFYYVNVAPQWSTFNQGNWRTMERNVREYAGLKRLDLDVYTGTYGVCTLPDENNIQQPLYLLTEGNTRRITVPKYYWKVAHDPVSGKGIAFIGVNNPYQFDQKIDVFCEDICNEISWVTWEAHDVDSGYGFCCEVDDFRQTVDYLPLFSVTGLLK